MRITVADYLMGRDKEYPGECTSVILDNAARTVDTVNSLLAVLEAEGVEVEANPNTKTPVSSGWRPAEVNGAILNAAPRSKHMSGEACDLYDPDGVIDEYLLAHPQVLIALRLYQEHPSATKSWCHVQTVAPRSGNRVFYP